MLTDKGEQKFLPFSLKMAASHPFRFCLSNRGWSLPLEISRWEFKSLAIVGDDSNRLSEEFGGNTH
ncbi:MAG TPA: hypothetical protein V6D26_04675 [Stenomitos sp.]